MGSFYLGTDSAGTGKDHFFIPSNKGDYLFINHGTVALRDAGHEHQFARMPFNRAWREGKTFISQSKPTLIEFDLTGLLCIIPDDKGGFYTCNNEVITYYKGVQQQYQIAFPMADVSSLIRMDASLYWANEKGAFKEITGTTVRDIALTGDMLQHPAYQPGVRNFEIYWSNVTGSAFLFLQNNLYQLTKNAAGNLDTRLVLTDFDCKANNIISIYYDQAAEVIYLGSLNKGLFTFSARSFKTLTIGSNTYDKDNIYYAQAAWDSNRVLTIQGHLMGLNGSTVLPLMKKTATWDLFSMLIDRRGTIWTRSADDINKFDSSGKHLLAKWHLKGGAPHLYEGRDNLLWIGAGQRGLYRLNPVDHAARLRPFLNHLAFPDVYCMQEEGTEFLWVGTAKGLYRLHVLKGTVDTIKGLEAANIRSLHISRPGEVWITTYGKGFFLYQDNRLIAFPLDKGKYLAMAHCFVEDDLGYCWIPTNKGLFQASKKDLLNYAAGGQQQLFYLYHAREEGFNTNEFNGGCQPCAVKLANGYISLPSFNGVVWFTPRTMKTVLPDKKIFVDKIEVDQSAVVVRDTIDLPRRFKLLKLYCSTPYARNSYNINMQYAWVEGSETPVWLPMNSEQVIEQSSLPHGAWSLIIRKVNGFGMDNYSYRTLTVLVPPAFYETWWFYALLGVLVICCMWIYARLRLQYIRRKNKQLEALVNNRTEELSKALSSLSESELNTRREMQVREILFTAISHDIGSPLKFMSMMAEELRDSLEVTNVPDKTKQYADDIFKSGFYLYHLTRNLLQYLRISEKKAALQYRKFDLHRLVEDKAAIFQPIARERNVTIENEVPLLFQLHSDPLLLEVIIHNLLDNAVKATRDGRITIRVESTEAGQTQLVVEDTGHGMREEVAGFFNTGVAAPEEIGKPGGTLAGFGLIIVNELVRLLQARLQIKTGSGGTKIHLVFQA
ncbi:hypothetical protein D3H65_05605 [Paraflavitalea soli]|uniref:histidine kinase n=2 Tax=Paraflavitalea soli TaxID=2315862 RepID=A0A3B7MJK6_9BACT|nr:hypothetical protein D3H65_05605 [Paraflavitalea soli]